MIFSDHFTASLSTPSSLIQYSHLPACWKRKEREGRRDSEGESPRYPSQPMFLCMLPQPIALRTPSLTHVAPLADLQVPFLIHTSYMSFLTCRTLLNNLICPSRPVLPLAITLWNSSSLPSARPPDYLQCKKLSPDSWSVPSPAHPPDTPSPPNLPGYSCPVQLAKSRQFPSSNCRLHPSSPCIAPSPPPQMPSW